MTNKTPEERWLDGEILDRPEDLRAAATWLMTRRLDAYSNAQHPEHAVVSTEVRRLHERACAMTPEGEQPL